MKNGDIEATNEYSSSTSASHVSLREAARVAFPVWLLSRAWVFLFVYWGHSQRPFLQPVRGGFAGVHNWWLNPWTTYDSEWYLRIATHGYDAVTAVFFPLYPLILRLAGTDPIVVSLWGVIVSNFAFWLGLALLYKLCCLEFDTFVAKWSIFFCAFFPASAVFSAVYTESVFLVFVVACFWAAKKEHWVWAGVLALLVSLTRNIGPVISFALLLAYFSRMRVNARTANREMVATRSGNANDIGALFLPLVGFVGFQIFLAWDLGTWGASVRSQSLFGRRIGWPWEPVIGELSAFFGQSVGLPSLFNLPATLLGLFLLFRYWKTPRSSHSVFLGGVLLMHLTYGYPAPFYTLGAIRYMMTTFPFVQRLALLLQRPLRRKVFRMVIVGGALACNAAMSYAFGCKFFLF